MANTKIAKPSISEINERFEVISGSSNSFHDIVKSGVYYVGNNVTDKPNSVGGLYILSSAYGDNRVMCGLYVVNSADSTVRIYWVRCSNGTFEYKQAI